MSDYYDILSVSKGANQDEIKKAFRKLAHQHHPDKNGGSDGKFKEINEAYQTLSNPEKRRQYDQFGSAFQGAGGPGPGGQGGYGGFGNSADFADAFKNAQQGQRVEFDFGQMGDLGDIFGQFFGGEQYKNRPRKGPDVQAQILVPFETAVFGAEKDVEFSDPTSGRGKSKKMKIKIPAGIADGQSIRLQGQGGPGANGGPPGDLYIIVGVDSDPRFQRQ